MKNLTFNKLYLILTDRCEYACRHCATASSPRKSSFMDGDIVERAVELYAENIHNGNPVVKLSGGNPLLHPLFEKIVNYIHKRIPAVCLDVLTNDYMHRKSPEKFERVVKFLQENGLRYLSLNSDLEYREGSAEDLAKTRNFCIGLASAGRSFMTITEGIKEKPHYLGSARKKLSLEECDDSARSSCTDLEPGIEDGKVVFPLNVNIDGHLMHCLFGIGNYASVTDSQEEIEKKLLDDPVPALLSAEKGFALLFSMAEKLKGYSQSYSSLPPNCSRLSAILSDRELVEELRLELAGEGFLTLRHKL